MDAIESLTKTAPSLESRRNIPSLDGLRAISITLVLLAHASLLRDFPTSLSFCTHFALLGVRVFYVISGYLITTLLLGELSKRRYIDLRRFYLRRTLRIFPPYYVFLGCVAIGSAAGVLSMAGARWLPALSYTSNIFSTRSWFIGHSWTLSMEEQFYICWPIVLKLLGRKGALWSALCVLICSPLLRVGGYLVMHSTRPSQIVGFDSIAAGCVLALLLPRLESGYWRRLINSRWFFLVPMGGGLTHLAGAKGTGWAWAFDICVGQTLVAVTIALSIAWCISHRSGVVDHILNGSAIRRIGVLSYSIYLWQEIFLWQGTVLPLGLALMATLGAATVSFLLIEKPSFWLRVKIEKALGWDRLQRAPDSPAIVASSA